jgi:hypothetical protein
MTIADVTAPKTARLIGDSSKQSGQTWDPSRAFIIDKRSRKVAYAVMTFGGFRGIGDEYRGLPQRALRCL